MACFSNGTEGCMYETEYCEKCVHYEGCQVWLAHLEYAYELANKEDDPGKIILDMLIPERPDGFADKCSMFYENKEV